MIWCPQTGLWVNLSAYILFRLYIRSRYVRQTKYSETVWKYFEISLRNITEIEYWNMGILIWTPISNGLTFIQPIYWIYYVFDSKYPVWKVKHLPALIISNPSCHKLPWLLWINCIVIDKLWQFIHVQRFSSFVHSHGQFARHYSCKKIRTMILCQHLREMLDITFYTGMTVKKLQLLIVSEKKRIN